MAKLYLTGNETEARAVASNTGAVRCSDRSDMARAISALRVGKDAVAPAEVMMLGVFVPEHVDVVLSDEALRKVRAKADRIAERSKSAIPSPGMESLENFLLEKAFAPICGKLTFCARKDRAVELSEAAGAELITTMSQENALRAHRLLSEGKDVYMLATSGTVMGWRAPSGTVVDIDEDMLEAYADRPEIITQAMSRSDRMPEHFSIFVEKPRNDGSALDLLVRMADAKRQEIEAEKASRPEEGTPSP